MSEHRQRYNEEFKRQTVKFVQEQKKTVTDIAEELNIPLSTLYDWISQYREFDNEPVSKDDKIRKLEKELQEKDRQLKARERKIKDTEEELAIVKKAVHIFSRPRP